MEIKHWNKEVFASDKIVRQKLLTKIEELDWCDNEGNLHNINRG